MLSLNASFTSTPFTEGREGGDGGGRGGEKKGRGWGCLSGHHVDLIDHSRTTLVCTHTHTQTLSDLINM